jgi:glycosyltransferase involved in cell wall biosynthesis
MAHPTVSLIVSTLGRRVEFERLLASLAQQSYKSFELIVVDQNDDDRVADILVAAKPSFPCLHIPAKGMRGLSAGRNIGWKRANGEIAIFPDDDCWYPPWFIERAVALFASYSADILGGRSTDETGRSINARYAKTACSITKRNVWICQIEWATLIRRSLLEALDGYDENLGIGAATPWQAAEGPDLILRALDRGARCYFDPAVYGYHDEIDTVNLEDWTVRKARAYARGMGFVLRQHRYGKLDLAYWVSRSLFNTLRHAALGNLTRARFYFAVARGRLEGWFGRVSGDCSF